MVRGRGTGTSRSSAREPLLPSANEDEAANTVGGRLKKGWNGFLSPFKKFFYEPTNVTLGISILFIGVICGVVAYVYSSILDSFLWFTWNYIPNTLVVPWYKSMGPAYSWFPEGEWGMGFYIVFITGMYGLISGASQSVLGSPGDMPDTVRSFHQKGYVPWQQAPAMFFVSLFSVTAGGSLGPEAPLLTLCATSVCFVYQYILEVKPSMLKRCSSMGMSAGLAAFFGVGMGGSLFAIEVPHRMGLEHYENTTYAVATGVMCLAVYRALAQRQFGGIWPFPVAFPEVDARHLVLGAVIGFMAGVVAIIWTYFTKSTKKALKNRLGLDEHDTPIICGAVGGVILGLIGAALPPTMFWGEFEMKTIADDTIPLWHIWPKGGFYGLAPFMQGDYTAQIYLAIGLVKLFAISVTLMAGFRGGFIFPLFTCGTCIGTALHMWLGDLISLDAYPVVLFGMCFASGLNTSITRTPLATPLILTTLCGNANVAAPCLCAAFVSLFLTKNVPFVASQQKRVVDAEYEADMF